MSNFMKGYTRTPEMTEKLIAALSFALRANPTLRMGQLITNAVNGQYYDIFNKYDENWIKLLMTKEK